MHRYKSLGIAFSALLTLALLGGCQNMMKSDATMAAPQKAIVVTGGQGGATAIFIPSSDGEHVIMLSTTGAKECAQCEADALKYFKTGELVAKCSACGAIRTAVTAAPDSHAHN